MKQLIRLCWLVLIVALAAAVGVSASVQAQAADAWVLARVDIPGRLEVAGLPVYAHLQDADGRDYALTVAPAAQLAGSGLAYRSLDVRSSFPLDGTRPEEGGYLLALERRPGARREAARLGIQALHDDGRHLILWATRQQAEVLSELGFDLEWLNDSPLVLRAAPPPVEAFDPDPLVAAMIAQVQQSTIYTYDGQLSGEWMAMIGGAPYTILTRHTNSGTPISKATQYVYEHMLELGLNASYHNWSSGRNVIGELPGNLHPDEIVLITAHIDDMPSSGQAPGADDNASGSVGVMVAADILSQYQFDRTLRFVFFTGEEQGLYGSSAYANAVYAAGDNIVAVYNMDMIAWDDVDGPTLRLHTRTTGNPGYPGDLAIAGVFTNVVSAYGLSGGLTPIIDADGESASDHSSFWNEGYAAILAIEDDDNDFNAYYHTSNDTLDTLNMAYFTNYVKASVGTAAHLAIPMPLRGMLTGVLTEAGTATPLAGGLVQASRGALLFQANSGADGVYSMIVTSGTYTLTASAYGYLPATLTNVTVMADVTVTRDFALTPAPTHTVDGVVSDAVAGWPLYARISIIGDPLSPPYNQAWSDPLTGAYYLVLPEGNAYILQINAWPEGYQVASLGLGALTGNRVENVALPVDHQTCNAPGYRWVGGWFEPFDGLTLPAGWSVVDNQGNGQVWRFNDPGGRGNLTGGAGHFAIVDSDDYGSSGYQDTELRSPALDFSAYSQVAVRFKTDFRYYTGGQAEVADVDVSANGAAGPWVNVWRKTDTYRGPKTEVIDITAQAAGQSNVMVRFHYYTANYEYWWQVDDVEIGPPQCLPHAGGLVVGNTYDAASLSAMAGVTVSNDSARSTVTAVTEDPAVDDGFYLLFSPSGVHTFTAQMPGYAAPSVTLTVAPSGTLLQDIVMHPLLIWSGGTSTDWHTPANWIGGRAPTSTDTVVIPTTPPGGRWPQVNAPAACYDLTIYPGAWLTLTQPMTAYGSVNNTGHIVQNQAVNLASGPVSFMAIEDGSGGHSYMGLVISPTGDMGNVQVTITGGACGAGGTLSQAVQRCYDIAPDVPLAATVRFYYRASEANGNLHPAVWHWNVQAWEALSSTFGSAGDAMWVEAAVDAYSPFTLKDSMPSLVGLRAWGAPRGIYPYGLLLAAGLVLGVTYGLLRRRRR